MDVRPAPFDPASLRALYADDAGGEGRPMEPATRLALEAGFGSVERWRDGFVAAARAAGEGDGWALLVFGPRDGSLTNRSAVDAAGAADGVPLLALDVREHARRTGAEADRCAEAFVDGLDWARVHARYRAAVDAATAPLAAAHADVEGAVVLDVRRAGAFAQADTMLPGARWRDPALVARWAGDCAGDREVIVYCVHGHEVSRATALRLRAAGVNARFLAGGLEGWRAAGRALVPRAA